MAKRAKPVRKTKTGLGQDAKGQFIGDNIHTPTRETRIQVDVLSAFGRTHLEIGEFLGISDKTLRKHYRKELNLARTKLRVRLGRALIEQATGRQALYNDDGHLVSEEVKPDKAVLIFMGKTVLNLKETNRHEHVLPGGIDASKLSDDELDTLRSLLGKASTPPNGE